MRASRRLRSLTKPELALHGNADGTGRAYRHPLRKRGDGSNFDSPSVTTVLKGVPKSLEQYAADCMLQWCIENKDFILNSLPDDITRRGRYRWKDAGSLRAEVGTGIHETIEALHTNAWTFPELDAEQRRIMGQWESLNEQYTIEPLRSEFTLWSIAHDYAGTADGLWEITDNRTGTTGTWLVDIKTSKKTWPEHWMQLSALLNADYALRKTAEGWVEDPWDEIRESTEGVAIIHLREDFAVIDFKPRGDPELEVRFQQFLSYRELWDLEKEITALQTSKPPF